ncbi:hypothetical protein HK100_008396 [Physocladia obscura]|uniref:Major facilitator superfamily (MFS) profile domain-containing protein n=1 Tax=Physocladia obscura TaxID=109957 RepID=A0AAD5T466_9FUNG|nr:hypothetical protein HK100_008396 [Physocladia obscura]
MGIPTKKLVYAYFICTVTSICMFLLGYDASTFNTVNALASWNSYFGDGSCKSGNATIVCPSILGNVNTGYTVGSIFSGFLIAPFLSDQKGRKTPLMVGAIFVIAFTFMQAFSTTYTLHVLARGGIGFGQGIMLPVGPVYLGELAPREIRGTMMSLWQVFYSVGALMSYCVGLITINQANLGNWQWLILKGRNEEAEEVLKTIRGDEDVEDEIEDMIEVIERERTENPGAFAAYKMIFGQWSIAKRLLLAMLINFGQQATGQSSLNNYSSQIYITIFSENTVAIINVVNAVCGILFTLNSTIFVDRVGRVKLFVVGAFGMAICSGAAAIVYDNAANKEDKSLGIALACILFAFIFFYKPTWGATTWIYTGEIFPIVVRAQAVSIAIQTQNIASLILGQVFPIMFTACQFNVFFFFMGINLLLAIAVSFYPETRGVSLEEIDQLFSNTADPDADKNIPLKYLTKI